MKPRIIVVGAAWYGDWAKLLYQAFLRSGYHAEIVYNNSLPSTIGGNSNKTTSFFEKSKAVVRRANPAIFIFLKKIRQNLAEREILVRLRKFDLSQERVILIFTWNPGSFWILKKLRAIKGLTMVLWLGEPPLRDATWEPKFDYFDVVFAVDEGFYLRDLKEERNVRRVGLLPLASDETIFHPLASVPEKYHADVVFVGKYLPSRARSLERIKHHRLKIYGYGWEAGYGEFPWLKEVCQGGVATSELNLAYNGAKVAIGTLGMPKDPYTTTTQRTFDIALTGKFQVCEEVPLTKKLFGENLGYFADDDDLERLVNHYLAHKDEREVRAKNSREVALRYTYTEAAKKIVAACEELTKARI